MYPTRQVLFYCVSTTNKTGSLDEGDSSRVIVRVEHACFSPLRADVCQHLTVEPRFRPPRGPLVLDSWSKLCTAALVTLRVGIQTTKLLEHHTLITFHLLWLIVQFIALGETIAGWHTAGAQHHPKVLG
jgi:hypothetical protein